MSNWISDVRVLWGWHGWHLPCIQVVPTIQSLLACRLDCIPSLAAELADSDRGLAARALPFPPPPPPSHAGRVRWPECRYLCSNSVRFWEEGGGQIFFVWLNPIDFHTNVFFLLTRSTELWLLLTELYFFPRAKWAKFPNSGTTSFLNFSRPEMYRPCSLQHTLTRMPRSTLATCATCGPGSWPGAMLFAPPVSEIANSIVLQCEKSDYRRKYQTPFFLLLLPFKIFLLVLNKISTKSRSNVNPQGLQTADTATYSYNFPNCFIFKLSLTIFGFCGFKNAGNRFDETLGFCARSTTHGRPSHLDAGFIQRRRSTPAARHWRSRWGKAGHFCAPHSRPRAHCHLGIWKVPNQPSGNWDANLNRISPFFYLPLESLPLEKIGLLHVQAKLLFFLQVGLPYCFCRFCLPLNCRFANPWSWPLPLYLPRHFLGNWPPH